MSKYVLYTDGACSGNPGPGGWAYVMLKDDNLLYEDCGGEEFSTNNRMEMTAVVKGLSTLPNEAVVEVRSDSAYIINAFKENWITNWIRRGWFTSSGSSVLNRDIWMSIIKELKRLNVTWKKIKGHSGIIWNERCDELASSVSSGSKHHGWWVTDISKGKMFCSQCDTSVDNSDLVKCPCCGSINDLKVYSEWKEGYNDLQK